MALQLSTDVRNARLDAIESTIGASAVLEIRSGAAPADCAAADSGTLLASLTLPADWMAAAANGVKTLSGTWEDASTDAAGTAGHFRIKDSTATTCHLQGTAGINGSGADLELDNDNIAVGQRITITGFTITDPNQ